MIPPLKLLRAIELARLAHEKQVRKYTGIPYFTHLAEVASIVSLVTNDVDTIATAYLHDTLEDTRLTFYELDRMMGVEVAGMVQWLTDEEDLGTRKERVAADVIRLSHAPAKVQNVKLADIISNTSTIRQHDPKFAKKYLEEKRAMFEVLKKGDPLLRQYAQELLK